MTPPVLRTFVQALRLYRNAEIKAGVGKLSVKGEMVPPWHVTGSSTPRPGPAGTISPFTDNLPTPALISAFRSIAHALPELRHPVGRAQQGIERELKK
jgi:hypothetical protein